MGTNLVTALMLLVIIAVCVIVSQALRSWMRAKRLQGSKPMTALALVLALCVTLYALGTFAMMMQVLLGSVPAAVLGSIVTIVVGVSIWTHDSDVIDWLVNGGDNDNQSREEQ